MNGINQTNLNQTVLALVVATARRAVADSKLLDETKRRWAGAIDKAHSELLDNPYWEFEGDVLLLSSATSHELYEVGRDGKHTGCKAAEIGFPCRHRAARKLLENYLAAINLPHIPQTHLDPSTATVPAARPQPATSSPKLSCTSDNAGAGTVSPFETRAQERANAQLAPPAPLGEAVREVSNMSRDWKLRNTGPWLWTLGYIEDGRWVAVEDFGDYRAARLALTEAWQFEV